MFVFEENVCMFLQTSVSITHPFTVLTRMGVFADLLLSFPKLLSFLLAFFFANIVLGGFVSIT